MTSSKDIEAYRKKILDEVNSLTEQKEAKSRLSEEEISSLGAAKRARHLEQLEVTRKNIDVILPQLLEIAGKKAEPVSVRLAALQAIQSASFLGPLFDPHRSSFIKILRQNAEDKSPSSRRYSVELLSLYEDDWVTDKLRESLGNLDGKIVSDGLALKYLGHNDHNGAAQIAEDIYEQLDNASKEQALKVLGAGPKSQAILEKTLLDKSADERLRMIGANKLRALSPEVFLKHADAVLGDEKTPNLKATYIAAVRGIRANESIIDTNALTLAAEKAAKKTRSPRVKKAVKQYTKRIKKSESK